MKDIIVDRECFIDKLIPASSDCHIKSEDERDDKVTFALTLERVIEIAFDCLIETYQGWVKQNPEKLLRKKLYSKGFKFMPKYKSEKELYQKICDYKYYNSLSEIGKLMFDLLSKVKPELRWELYLVLQEWVDVFL